MKNRLSLFALFLCYVVMCYTAFVFYPKWEKSATEATISWDASGYYFYLPATFIYKDLKQLRFKDSILQQYHPTPELQQAFLHQPSGHYVMKYAAGQAVTMLPWFTIGHLWAKTSPTYPSDGFSFPYQICLGIGMFCYALIGLWYLRRVLLLFFSDGVVAVVLLLLALGTNYLNYAAIDQAMTHSTLFTIYALLMWVSHLFYQQPGLRRAVAIGALCGLATLIRPTDIISVLVPILWGVNRFSQVRERGRFLARHRRFVGVAIISFAALLSIQLVYWKYVTGSWIVYSYQEQGFNWRHPHLEEYLFSYRCGWLRYCPLMIVALLGIPFLLKRGVNRYLIGAGVLLSIYIASAWDVWDYGGTAGRAMVQYYTLLAFPLAALVQYTLAAPALLRIIGLIVMAGASYLGIWWVYQAHAGNIQIVDTTESYYWKTIGRWRASESDTKLLDNPFSYEGPLLDSTLVFATNFTGDTSPAVQCVDTACHIVLGADRQYSDKYPFTRNDKIKSWIRAYATFTATRKEWDIWKQTQFILTFYKGDSVVQNHGIRVYRFLNDDETRELYVDAQCPDEWDRGEVLFWHADGQHTLFIDHLRVVSFDVP